MGDDIPLLPAFCGWREEQWGLFGSGNLVHGCQSEHVNQEFFTHDSL